MDRLGSAWHFMAAPLRRDADALSALPGAARRRACNYILSVHEQFGQQPPSREELIHYVDKATEKAGGARGLAGRIAGGYLRESFDVRPLKIEMDIVNKCNLRCPMCMMSHPSHYRRPLERMSLATFERLADEIFWHVDSLSFTFGAEPLLHPDFPRFVEIASRYRIPQLYTVTNGILLTEEVARSIVTHGLHVLAVSVDAAQPRTYDRIRIGGDWHRLMRNLESLQRIKRDMATARPALELTFVMMKSNISELPRFVEMAAKLGANSVNATHMVPFAPLNTAQESCTLIKEETNEMLAQAASRAAQLGLRFSGPQPFGATAQNNTGAQAVQRFTLPASTSTLDAGHCPFPWHFAAFDMYGNVNPCGWWHHEPCMGNIRSDSFLSIWNGKRYRRLRAEHACGELREACRNCPAAGLGRVDNQRAFAER